MSSAGVLTFIGRLATPKGSACGVSGTKEGCEGSASTAGGLAGEVLCSGGNTGGSGSGRAAGPDAVTWLVGGEAGIAG
jgi:hypothetical protein